MLYSEWRREFQGWMKLYEPIYSNILERQQCLLLCPFVFGRDVTLGAYSQLFIPYFIPSVLHIPARVLSHWFESPCSFSHMLKNIKQSLTPITEKFQLILVSPCPAALHKDMGSCRAATITGTLSRISLNDEEDEKAPEGLNYSTLPGNIISKVIIQQPSALHMPMGMGELKEQCMVDTTADIRRTVYLCTDDALRQSDQDMGVHDKEGHPMQSQMMETDYIVMPRASAAVSGSGNVPTLLKDDTKMNITMDTLPHERLMHYKMSPDFNINPSGMDHMNVNLEQQYPSAPEQMQNLPFEPRTAVKNFLAEMEESTGLSRSETGSTISMSSLEVHMLMWMKHRRFSCTLTLLC